MKKAFFFFLSAILLYAPHVLAADWALSFDGTDDYVDLGKPASLDLGANFEISFWIKYSTSRPYYILQRGSESDNDLIYWHISSTDEGRLEFQLSDGSGNAFLNTSTAVNDGSWHKIVWTRDADSHTVTVDGVDRTLIAIVDPNIGDVNNPGRNIYMGAEKVINTNFFDGAIDGLRIAVDGVVKGIWYFDQGSGSTLTDSSDNKNNGTIYGAAWVQGNAPAPESALPSIPKVSTASGPVAYRPEVEITGPGLGESFHYIVNIDYRATDKNDKSALESERRNFGLGENPVSIYYSETGDVRKRTLIASNLPAGPRYQWDATTIPDGNTYRIIVEAKDNFGETSEAVSNAVIIDHTPPFFKVKAEPAFSQGEDVKLIIDANERLAGPPEVTVRQRGFRPVSVELTGGEQYLPTLGQVVRYEGLYRVISGYDGQARISIRARDRAGLVGTTIVSGDTFSVGIDTPVSPIITEPLNNDIIAEELIIVKGKAREDTNLALTVNGTDKYEAKPDEAGDFIFKDIRLYPAFNRGNNFISIVSIDRAGNVSEPATVNVSFNKSPELRITDPEPGEAVQGDVDIVVDALDRNDDPLAFTYEISADDGQTWETLIKETNSRKFSWHTPDWPDGPYLTRVIASDGTAETEAVSSEFAVSNFLPVIKFDEEKTPVISRNDYELSGQVIGQRFGRRTLAIKELEYSSNNGQAWTRIQAKDGEYDSADEKFSARLSGFADGLNKIIFRARDARGFYGRAAKNIIVDFGPPEPPVIAEPRANSIIANSDDKDLQKAGIQFTLLGHAEANAGIRAVLDGNIYEQEIGSDGKFEISGLTLRTHGENKLFATVIDPAGNESKKTEITYILNSPPEIKFTSPRREFGLSGSSRVAWQIQDPDGDAIVSQSLSSRKGASAGFLALTNDLKTNEFFWNVSGFADGIYQLKLEASDGVSKSENTIEVIIEHTPPKIFLNPFEKTVFGEDFVLRFSGNASDNLSGIEFVEYSLDGEHWFKAAIVSGYRTESASFRASHPFQLDDGRYELRLRAIDNSGNLSIPVTQTFLVDTSAPRIGSYLLKSEFDMVSENAKFRIPERETLKFELSLEEDAAKASLFVADQEIALAKNPQTGLWQSSVSVPTPGAYIMEVAAQDGFGNKTQRNKIGEIIAESRPKIADAETETGINGAEVEVFVLDTDENRFVRWPAESFGLKNPITSDERGEYRLLLPAGKYRLDIKKDSYTRAGTGEFDLESSSFIIESFKLKKRTGIRGAIENILESILPY